MPGAPEVAQYGSRVQYPRPSPGVLEVDPSMQVWVDVCVSVCVCIGAHRCVVCVWWGGGGGGGAGQVVKPSLFQVE